MPKHIIAILNQKGGVGKTTTAINVAAYLAKNGRSVLLVDSDPQGNTTSGLGVDKHSLDGSLYSVLLEGDKPENVIRAARSLGIDVLPSNEQLASAEVELVNQERREFRLREVLAHLEYDYILLDCPPSLGLLSINALTAASDVIVPVQAEYYALEGLSQLLQVITEVKKALNPNLYLLGILLTMYDGRTGLSEQVKQEVVKHFGNKLFKTVIPRNVRLAEAPSFGRTILEHDKWSKGARAYKSLVKEMEKRAHG